MNWTVAIAIVAYLVGMAASIVVMTYAGFGGDEDAAFDRALASFVWPLLIPVGAIFLFCYGVYSFSVWVNSMAHRDPR